MALYHGTQLVAGAADISIDQILKSGEHIATVSANGTATALYAPNNDERISSLETSVSALHELLTELAKTLSGEVVPLHFNGDAFFDVPFYSRYAGLSVESFKLSCRLDEGYERRQEIVWFNPNNGYGDEVAFKQTYGISSQELSLSVNQVVSAAQNNESAKIGLMPHDLLLGISVEYDPAPARISAEAYYPNEPGQKISVGRPIFGGSGNEGFTRIFQGQQSASSADEGVRGTFYGLSCYGGDGTLLAEYLPFAKGQIAMILKKTPAGTLTDIPLQGGAVDVIKPA